MKTRQFCHLCSAKLVTENNQWRCTGCGHMIYNNPKGAVGIIFFDNNDRAVLAIRGEEPHKGLLDTIGGFLDANETFEAALVREIEEETGLISSDYSAPIYIGSDNAGYEYDGETIDVVSPCFYAKLINDSPQAKDDISGFKRVKMNEVKPADFAWPIQYDLFIKAFGVHDRQK